MGNLVLARSCVRSPVKYDRNSDFPHAEYTATAVKSWSATDGWADVIFSIRAHRSHCPQLHNYVVVGRCARITSQTVTDHTSRHDVWCPPDKVFFFLSWSDRCICEQLLHEHGHCNVCKGLRPSDTLGTVAHNSAGRGICASVREGSHVVTEVCVAAMALGIA